jgi:hypothetical protein
MVISVWVEEDEHDQVRARITATRELSAIGDAQSWVVVGEQAACLAFRRWLKKVTGPSAGGPAP